MAKKTMKELVAYAKKRAKEHHKYKTGKKVKMSWNTYFDCHWFVKTVYKDCGYKDIYNRMNNGGYWKKPWRKQYLGPYLVQHNSKGLKESKLKPGDIVIRHLTHHNGYHSAIYVGNGKVAETTSGRGSHIGKLTKRYTHAFRIPEPEKKVVPTPKKEVKTVEHVATYQALEARNVKKSYSSKSDKIISIPKGKKFKTTKKHGNWVYGTVSFKGWICIKSKGKSHCKKI